MNSSYQVVDLGTWYKLDLIQEKDNGVVLLYLIFFFYEISSIFTQTWIEVKVNGVSKSREKNEAPDMFENVLVFGGLVNPAEGMFRNLVFSSYYGKLSHCYCLI